MPSNELVGSVHALKRRSNPNKALELLHRIAAQVRPIMEKRGWKVGTLREFFPNNPNLLGLNVNHGQEIRIRLRPSFDDKKFLIYEDLLGTMLHELVHIVRGPHDAVFYAKLDELKREAEELLDRGYTGDGFFSQGSRVGLDVSHNAPRHEMRERALRAIENRRNRQFGGPPRTLGGGNKGGSWAEMQARFTPAQMAAMALERRLRDERWCGETMAGAVKETRPDSDDNVVALAVPENHVECIVISDSEPDPDQQASSSSAEVVIVDE
ncbi:hypothetical protein LPJ64_005084 [Coemansia asiatica]|uniref:WLM domain-containing protein n=1 Tax=Coemansia asiatica TaxID=1052880 RepID=A0A9W8CHA4_9FUNG|nr:hypothetical protein LPJ64_005084 [Coemansia asiatica]